MTSLIPSTSVPVPEGMTVFTLRWYSWKRVFEAVVMLNNHWYKSEAPSIDEAVKALHKKVLCGESVGIPQPSFRSAAPPPKQTLAEQEEELNKLLGL